MNFFGGHVVILKAQPIMRNNSFWLKMCSTALCFTKALTGMLKQDDNINIISLKLFVRLDTFLKESSYVGWTKAYFS